METRLVVAASSLTSHSDEIVRVAARAARGGRLELVHALEPTAGAEEGPQEFHGAPGEWLEMLIERARRALRQQASRLGLAPKGYSVSVGFGAPLDVLVRRVHELEPWLVVIGAEEGERTGRRAGALAHRLAQEGRRPTLVVRPGRAFPPRRVVAALDFSPVSEAALARALELARFAGGPSPEVECVHALHLGPWKGVLAGDTSRAEAEARERLRSLAEVGAVPGLLAARTTLLAGPPRECLLAHVEREAPDLVAVGLSGYGGVDRLLAASVAERLVRDSTATVLVVPPRVLRDDRSAPSARTSAQKRKRRSKAIELAV